MNPLEDGHFPVSQAQGLGEDVGAHLPGELVLGDVDHLSPVQPGEVLAQQVHVQAEGGLVVHGPLPGPGGRLRVEGLEVVVHGDGVALHAHLLQPLLDLQGRGGLPGAGGAREQDHVGLHLMGGDLPGGGLHLLGKGRVALLGEGGGVAAYGLVDSLQRIHKGSFPAEGPGLPQPSR